MMESKRIVGKFGLEDFEAVEGSGSRWLGVLSRWVRQLSMDVPRGSQYVR